MNIRRAACGSVSAKLEGLAPGTTFRFRVSATNAIGTSKGAEMHFTTMAAIAPTAETGTATGVGRHTAVLNATVDPNGALITACKFEYGTTSLSSSVQCAKLPGLGTSPVPVTATLKTLLPNTKYRFRILTTSLSGTGRGLDATFTTTM